MFFYEFFLEVFFSELILNFLEFEIINFGIEMAKSLFHFNKSIIFLLIV
jgi:hypothetical protein